MENNPAWRKRRRSASQQIRESGTFTRSRFELFIHRTRSGRGWADPDLRRKFSREVDTGRPMPSERIPIEGQRPGSGSFVDGSLISVKDLRTRRVFSPASVIEERSPEKKPKIQIDPNDRGRPELGFDGKAFCEQKIDGGVGFSGESVQAMSSESDCKSSESNDAKTEVGFGGEGCYKEQIIENGIEAISGGMDGSDGTSSESSDVKAEVGFGGEASDSEQKFNSGIEAISGGLDCLDEMTQTTPPESDRRSSKWSNVQREVGFDGEEWNGHKKIKSGIEAIPLDVEGSGREWIQTTPPDSDILRKSDVQEDGGDDRGIHRIDVEHALENPSNVRISGNNLSLNEGFVQSKKDATDAISNNRPGLVRCSRLKLFQTPNSLSYRRLLPFLMDLAKDNASSLEIHPCKSLYSAKFKKMVVEKPHPPLLDSRSHLADLGSGKADILCGQNQVDLETPITERSVENRHDGLGTSLTEVPKENSLDDLSSCLIENQRGTCSNVLEIPIAERSVENGPDGLGISLTEVPIPKGSSLGDLSSSLIENEKGMCPDVLGTPIAERSVENRLDGLGTYLTEVLKESSLDGLSSSLIGNQRGKVPPVLETPITERSVENRLHGLGTPLTDVPKESSLDGLSRSLIENQRGKCPHVLETPLKGKSKEKSCDALEISLTEKSKEMSSGTPCLNGFETPPAYKSVEVCHAVNSSDPAAESQIIESLEEYLTETPIQNASRNSITLRGPGTPMLPDLCTRSVTQLDQVIADTSCKLDLDLDSVGSMTKIELQYESMSISPTCNEDFSIGCANNIQDAHDFPRKAEEEIMELVSALSTEAKPIESLSLQHSSQSDYSIHLETPVLPPMKGILKMHPRECRGLCMCPDCASFRLHAEKANEFSRRQMQDAEGVAVGLMKELSCLRSVMEKIIVSGAGSVKDHAIVQVNQIKGIYRRASRAEELARDRLRQMTRDLNTHCRITTLQRPKVRFANNIEEELILGLEKEDDG